MLNLKSRNNSWPKDLMVVAGLLAGVKPDLNAVNIETRIMQQIITSYSKIAANILVHGSPTVIDHGPLSWCPTNLFSGTHNILPQNETCNSVRLAADKRSGSVTGLFVARTLSALSHELDLLCSRKAAEWKLMTVLRRKTEYLILTCNMQQRL